MKTMAALLLALILVAPAVADDNVVILLDTSLSMTESMGRNQGSKMDAAKMAITEVLDHLPKGTNLGIVTFNGWAVPLARLDISRTQQAVITLMPFGATPLGQYMKAGADALLKVRADAHGLGTYTLIVITDGEASDEAVMNKYAPEIVSRGMTLKTIGVRMQQEHTLKNYSAAYYSANDLKGLQHAVATAVAEVAASDDASEADYAVIDGLPDEMASKIVATLTETVTLNYGIGDPPPPKPVYLQNDAVTPVSQAFLDAAKEGSISMGAVLSILVMVVLGVGVLIIVIRGLGRSS